MEMRRIGSSDLLVSAVGLGTFNTVRKPNAVRAVVDKALDLGVTLFDTAESYGNGAVEAALGAALGPRRKYVVLATKWGDPNHASLPGLRPGSRDYIVKALEQSLKRLRTDYIDLYQYHHRDPETPIDETMRALDELIRGGKVRYWGVSNMRPHQIAEIARLQQELGLKGFVSCQRHYNVIAREQEEQLLPILHQCGIGLLPNFPLERGLLTGKYRRGEPPPPNSRLGRAAAGPRHLTPEKFDLIERLERFAAEEGHTLLELAISWLLANPEVASVIAGATTAEQVAQNVFSGNWALTRAELGKIDRLVGRTPVAKATPPAASEVAEAIDPRIAELRHHIRRKLLVTPTALFPFPHMIIEHFFPKEVYENILRFNLFQWNDGVPWFSDFVEEQPRFNKVNSTPYQRRTQIYIDRLEETSCPPEALDFWKMIGGVFSGDWFPRLVESRYPEYFAFRYGENVLRDDFWDRCRSMLFVQRHEADYFLGPHTDLPGRIFTCIFSFPETAGFEQHGTQLLRYRAPYVVANGHRHFDFDEFETVKTAEYKPNNFLLFFKTAHSFHCVNRLPDGIVSQRYGMQFQFHEPSQGLLRDLEAPTSAQHRPRPVTASTAEDRPRAETIEAG
jgi:aryl-alcohol dehydrogenase-like predicted oxidoreductase